MLTTRADGEAATKEDGMDKFNPVTRSRRIYQAEEDLGELIA